MITKNKIFISIFIIWLFNLSGIVGILSSYSAWFLGYTSLNLLIYVVLIIWNLENISKKVLIAFSIPFFIGFFTEYLGVNYGLLFGTYSYGNNLGIKIWGVPLMICVNWGLLTIITADLSRVIHKNIFVRSLLGGVLMMILDLIIEVSAPRFDFWQFENNTVPLKNYIAWFIIGSVAHYLYNQISLKTHVKLSIHILVAITFFFVCFLFF
ncbi:MAG: carotenoid biosynthesis protein [Flavobacteriales bacterium]|nr:carotenoid biosynthesis protein [Flavobacteriales bacterium]